MVGEWGWQPASSGELAWIDDKELAWANAGAAIQIEWNYDVTTNTGVNFWAARPGDVWRPSASDWMTNSG